jgi:para-aminobenzoate synthetase component 1
MAGTEWVWQHFPCNGRTGSDIFGRLGRDQPLAALLESPPGSSGRYSLCAAGSRWVTPSLAELVPWMTHHLVPQPPSPQTPPHLPFVGGWWGWLAYEAVWAWERLPALAPDPLPFPVALWFQPDWCAIVDHHHEQLSLGAANDNILHLLTHKLDSPCPDCCPDPVPAVSVQWQLSPQAYQQRVQQVQKHIQAGDIFQANLSVRFGVPTPLHPWQVYQTLTRLNPSPFACYWQTPWGHVVSCSPERLVLVQDNLHRNPTDCWHPSTRCYARSRPEAGPRTAPTSQGTGRTHYARGFGAE